MKIIVLILLAMTCALGCHRAPAEANRVHELAEDQGYALPKFEELPTLKAEAMAGSGLAARRLALWYSKHPEKEDTYKYWTQISAENGSAIGQYNLALIYLVDQGLDHDRIRARYWLEKAAAQGDAKAKEELSALGKEK